MSTGNRGRPVLLKEPPQQPSPDATPEQVMCYKYCLYRFKRAVNGRGYYQRNRDEILKKHRNSHKLRKQAHQEATKQYGSHTPGTPEYDALYHEILQELVKANPN